MAYSGNEAHLMPVDISTPPALDEIFLHDLPLSKRATFFPLGFPFEVRTNSEVILTAARQSWDSFSPVYAETPLVLELAVMEAEDQRRPPRPRFRSQRHLMSIVADAENQVICDFNSGHAAGWVTRRAAEDANYLRLHFLEAVVGTMLVQAHLASIHGALVAREGRGVVLCGDSYAGKSTLAYACARSGWTYVSDDGTFLLRKGDARYGVGNPRTIRLREDAKLLFPEMAGHRVTLRPNGERGMEVSTSTLPVETAGGCAINHVVFLKRSGAAGARIERVEARAALERLERVAFYGTEQVQASQKQTYRRLLSAGLWELHYSALEDAVSLLNGLGECS